MNNPPKQYKDARFDCGIRRQFFSDHQVKDWGFDVYRLWFPDLHVKHALSQYKDELAALLKLDVLPSSVKIFVHGLLKETKVR